MPKSSLNSLLILALSIGAILLLSIWLYFPSSAGESKTTALEGNIPAELEEANLEIERDILTDYNSKKGAAAIDATSDSIKLGENAKGFLSGILTDNLLGGPGQASLQVVPVLEDGQPAMTAPVASFDTEADGGFRAELLEGDYYLIATKLDQSMADPITGMKIPTMGFSTPLRQFHISPNEITNLLIFLPAGATLHGAVVDPDNPQRSTFWVHLFRNSDRSLIAWSLVAGDPGARGGREREMEDGTPILDRHGYFVFPRLDSGEYTLEVSLVRSPGAPPLEPWTKSFFLPADGLDIGQLLVSRRELAGLDSSSIPSTDGTYTRKQIRGRKAKSQEFHTSNPDDLPLNELLQRIMDEQAQERSD